MTNPPFTARPDAQSGPDALLAEIRGSDGDERQRALRRGAAFFDDEILVAWLRNDADDVLRNAGLEMLKLRRHGSYATAIQLLGDSDGDVVLQSIQLLAHIGDARAWPHLRRLLRHPDPNIVQATITAAARVGGRQAIVDLLPFLEADLWLQMAAIETLGHLRARSALPALGGLLRNADLRQLAAEALARIGGPQAARALSRAWLTLERQLEPDRWLPLLAEALISAEMRAPEPGLREAVASHLESEIPDLATAAASCILAMGPGAYDGRALDVLTGSWPDAGGLPPALEGRLDLAGLLLDTAGRAREWSYELVRHNPKAASRMTIEKALAAQPPRDPATLAAVAAGIRDHRLLVNLYLRSEDETRRALEPLLRRRRGTVMETLAEGAEQSGADRALLLELAGAPATAVVDAIMALPAEERLAAAANVRTRRVAQSLPWTKLIAAEQAMVDVLADLAAALRLKRVVPLLREQLAQAVTTPLVHAIGVLRDRASAQLLIDALKTGEGLAARAHLFDSLGAIGGRTATATLRQYATGDDQIDARLAARAVAHHATSDDLVFVEDLTKSPDWAVRLSAVEGLERISGKHSRALLTLLLNDVSAVVAEKARIVLDARGGRR